MKEIKTVSIVGANGIMGRNVAAIFASFGNAKVYLISRSMEKSNMAKEKAFKSVRAESIKNRMVPCDYSHLEECVRESDLIFEACAEDWEVKISVHQAIARVLKNLSINSALSKVVCSGTSGLSITSLAKLYGESFRSHVIGMHFFNPPYQMTLCELVSTIYTDRNCFEKIYCYAKNILFRTVVEVKDAPAFLGNRIGFYFINEAMLLAEKYKHNGGIDYIDAILGPFSGRVMPPLITANFVGLDVHRAIVNNLYENTNDFAHESFRIPNYVESLVEDKKMGKKTGVGLYKTVLDDKIGKLHQVYDIDTASYRDTIEHTFVFAEQMLSFLGVGDYEAAFRVLKKNRSLEAEICMEAVLKYILYSLETVEEEGYDVHAADDVMATGFNWCPPLAMIEALGGKGSFRALCRERISENWMNKEKQDYLSNAVTKSEYDYRRFIKAKR